MGKELTRFVCGECGFESPKWLGKCPGCHCWNTLTEEVVRKNQAAKKPEARALPLPMISTEESSRFSSGIAELDRVLGGGIVPGSLILLGGDPGVGKSTLLLQAADNISRSAEKVLYLSGEESLKQIRLRAQRLSITGDQLYLINEPDVDLLEHYLSQIDPRLLIVDSIQTVYSSEVSSIPGSVAQLRECTARIAALSKKREQAVILIGHVTKDGALAGPKTLEHMVDAVVYFEGDRDLSLRVLRGVKNRFGSTDEIGLMEMSGKGLIEVPDPSEVFLSTRGQPSPGTAVAACFEGSRSFLIEIQALVSPCGPGYGRRMAAGIDQNRLALIIAVLEKRCGFQLSNHDIYLKVSGGVFLKDPSVDLGIAAAILSSYREQIIPAQTVFMGEISLSGLVRPVHSIEKRLRETSKMGYSRVVLPRQIKRQYEGSGLELLPLESVEKLLNLMEG